MALNVTEKKFDFDDIIKFAGPGGDLESAFRKIQDDLVKLRQELEVCEELFHGNGPASSINKCYQNLYNKIGTPSIEKSMWYSASLTRDVIDSIYNNAVSTKNMSTE